MSRADELIAALQLQPHPEGGWYREWFRAASGVRAADGRERSALTSIDFLLKAGQWSAWHRVASDEVWHVLEGRLTLWTFSAARGEVQRHDLGPGQARQVVLAGDWQAAEPAGDFAYVGATVAPGFDFADFSFLRDDAAAFAALRRLAPELIRLA